MRKFKLNGQGSGFTLIELLVVVAIIGLLASIISSSVTVSRIRSRDARRITDLKQVKTGMDIYFANAHGYPDTGTWVAGVIISCAGTSAFQVPRDPVSPTYNYLYAGEGSSVAGCATTVRSDYEIEFYIENKARYYIMEEDGNLRDKITDAPVTFDSLL